MIGVGGDFCQLMITRDGERMEYKNIGSIIDSFEEEIFVNAHSCIIRNTFNVILAKRVNADVSPQHRDGINAVLYVE